MMNDPDLEPTLAINTPEQVEFEYELAGLGSRFLAFLFDSLVRAIISMVLFALAITLLAIGGLFEQGSILFDRSSGFYIWLFAIGSIVLYLLNSGYYVLFETIWNGQSPGKKLLDLRVVREGGYPIGFYEAAIRNILRIVDIIPGSYLVGALSVLFSSKNKRVGDYVAGTVVIKEKQDKIPEKVLQDISYILPDEVVSGFVQVGRDEYDMVMEFLERKDEMDSSYRKHMAQVFTESLTKKLNFVVPEGVSCEDFLLAFVEKYRKEMKFFEA